MIRFLLCTLAAFCFPHLASTAAPGQACQQESACVLEAAWSAALLLPEEKQDRLKPLFLDVAAATEDAALIKVWSERFNMAGPIERPQAYPDYGWGAAEPILAAGGVDSLIEHALARKAPLHYGRADALLAAGKHFVATDPDAATRLNQALLDLTRNASDFEKPTLAHAAAELAMTRCDLPHFDQATALVDAPSSLRYAYWRARIKGSLGDLLTRSRNSQETEDTRHVRQILDGYRAIQTMGYCASVGKAVAG